MSQNYTGTISNPWENIDILFKEKKTHEKQSMTRLYPKVSKQKGEIDTEPKSEEGKEINDNS
ncbi:9935_t:CDS:2 [Ambispora gerdemannii]|uniref:9935_t:CDS:1 n=1 Tax=Ambispora gerdemannii TaxID=144530 RepID=A0A9N9CW80_9GLOM|nr:9935_t:CDS:2 [Ambispora gerdemannii]